MFVCCECCVLSDKGLCDELITRPEESYRLWCVVVCDQETSWMRWPWPTLGRSAKENKTSKTNLKTLGSLPHNCLLRGVFVSQFSDVNIKQNIWVSTTPLQNPEEISLTKTRKVGNTGEKIYWSDFGSTTRRYSVACSTVIFYKIRRWDVRLLHTLADNRR